MRKREDRRDRTYRYGAAARREHLRVVHPDGEVDCICERSAWFFAKKKAVGCGCRRRKKGMPKLVVSLCHMDVGESGYHPTVRERIDGRRLCRSWLAVRGDLDDADL